MNLYRKNTKISIFREIYKPDTKNNEFRAEKTHVFIKKLKIYLTFYKTQVTLVLGCTTFGFVTLSHPVRH